MSSNSSIRFALSAPLVALTLILASCGAADEVPVVLAAPDSASADKDAVDKAVVDNDAALADEVSASSSEEPATEANHGSEATDDTDPSDSGWEPEPILDEFLNDAGNLPLSEVTITSFLDITSDLTANYVLDELEGDFVSSNDEFGWAGRAGDKGVIRLFADADAGTLTKVALAVPELEGGGTNEIIMIMQMLGAAEGAINPFAGSSLIEAGGDQFGEHTISGGNNSVWYCITSEDLTEVGLGPSLVMTVVDSAEGPICHESGFFTGSIGPVVADTNGITTWNDDGFERPTAIDTDRFLEDWEPNNAGYAMGSANILDFQETWDEMWHPSGDMTLYELDADSETDDGTVLFGAQLYEDKATLLVTAEAHTGIPLQIVAEYPMAEKAILIEYFANVVAAAQGNVDGGDSLTMIRKAVTGTDLELTTGGNDNIWFCIFRSDLDGSEKEPTLMIVVVDAIHGGDCFSDSYLPAKP